MEDIDPALERIDPFRFFELAGLPNPSTHPIQVAPAMKAAFWSHVLKEHTGPFGCWVWVGDTSGRYFYYEGERISARRFAYETEKSPATATVKTYCKRHSCVRPDHLYLAGHYSREEHAKMPTT